MNCLVVDPEWLSRVIWRELKWAAVADCLWVSPFIVLKWAGASDWLWAGMGVSHRCAAFKTVLHPLFSSVLHIPFLLSDGGSQIQPILWLALIWYCMKTCGRWWFICYRLISWAFTAGLVMTLDQIRLWKKSFVFFHNIILHFFWQVKKCKIQFVFMPADTTQSLNHSLYCHGDGLQIWSQQHVSGQIVSHRVV